MGAASDKPGAAFHRVPAQDRDINAFATLGGYVAVNAGLITSPPRTRANWHRCSATSSPTSPSAQHVLRSVEQAKKDSLPILLAMLGAIAVAQGSNSDSASNGAMAALILFGAGPDAAAADQLHPFGRSQEADRLGIRTLYRAGFDPGDAARMFQRMLALSRSNQGGERERTPDRRPVTHPVTTSRISEATASAPSSCRASWRWRAVAVRSGIGSSGNPLLPGNLSIQAGAGGDDGQFAWAQERLRRAVGRHACAGDPRIRADAPFRTARRRQQYGLAVAQIRACRVRQRGRRAGGAQAGGHPARLWLQLGIGRPAPTATTARRADARFDALVARMPDNRGRGPADLRPPCSTARHAGAGRRAQAILRPLLNDNAGDPGLQAEFARACEHGRRRGPRRRGLRRGRLPTAGGPEQALTGPSCNTLKNRPDLDHYAAPGSMPDRGDHPGGAGTAAPGHPATRTCTGSEPRRVTVSCDRHENVV